MKLIILLLILSLQLNILLMYKLFKTHDALEALEDTEPGMTRGRVVTVTAAPVYDPEQKVDGGRVVRVMPKSLKKIKEAQEKAPSEV